jgi:hypothetical protein
MNRQRPAKLGAIARPESFKARNQSQLRTIARFAVASELTIAPAPSHAIHGPLFASLVAESLRSASAA